jgi:hypothetical protein
LVFTNRHQKHVDPVSVTVKAKSRRSPR